jgi:hypothetical protein
MRDAVTPLTAGVRLRSRPRAVGVAGAHCRRHYRLRMDATAIAIAAVTGAVGLIAGVVGTAYKSRKALESEYDIDLRKARIEVYKELWSALELLAKYSPPGFSRGSVEQLSVTLRRWYFERGGIFLSKRARNAYFDLQEALVQTLECLMTRRHCASSCVSAAALFAQRWRKTSQRALRRDSAASARETSTFRRAPDVRRQLPRSRTDSPGRRVKSPSLRER